MSIAIYLLLTTCMVGFSQPTTNVYIARNNEGLTEVPDDIPANVTYLKLNFNPGLENADYSKLSSHLLLERVDVSYCDITTFPNLTVLRSNMTHIVVHHNALTTIPRSCLEGLKLETLSLSYNEFTVFPDLSPVGATLLILNIDHNDLRRLNRSDVESLTRLETLNLADNQLLFIEDIAPLSASLKSLSIRTGMQTDQPSLEHLFENFTKLESLLAEERQIEVMPDLTSSCSQLKVLHLHVNKIAAINSSFIDTCTSMVRLDLANNILPELPNITAMGGTLIMLNVGLNDISIMDQNFMRAQRALVNLTMQNNKISEFPDVSQCGETLEDIHLATNRIPNIDPNISRSLHVLDYVDLQKNQLTAFPDFTGSNNTLRELYLSENQIASIPEELLRPLVMLRHLGMANNLLSSIPDVSLPILFYLDLSANHFNKMPVFNNLGQSVKHLYMGSNDIARISEHQLAALRDNIEVLGLSNTLLQYVPYLPDMQSLRNLDLSNSSIHTATPRALASLGKMVSVDLSSTKLRVIASVCPQGGLTLNLEDIPTLDLCSRSMAWLKQTFFTVEYTDVLCSDLGKMWSAASFQDLLRTNSSAPETGDTRQLLIGGHFTDTLCTWPSSGIMGGMTMQHCIQACLEDEGCQSFNYNEPSQSCAIVAPTEGHEIPLTDSSTSWTYYAP